MRLDEGHLFMDVFKLKNKTKHYGRGTHLNADRKKRPSIDYCVETSDENGDQRYSQIPEETVGNGTRS